MKIGFIGAGNVGFSLGKYFSINNINVLGYYSLNEGDSIEASLFTNSECYKDLFTLINQSDALFLTVNDDAIGILVEEMKKLNIKNKILIHTSGCKSSKIFDTLNDFNYCYSIHPIYAFTNKYEAYKLLNNVTFTIEGNDKYLDLLINLFKNLGNNIINIKTENKVKYHLSCVMMSNLCNSLIDIAYNELKDIGIEDSTIFDSLILNNIKSILEYGTRKSITGPAIRDDLSTIDSHIREIEGDTLKIYSLLTKHILDYKEEKNKEIDNLLEGVLNEKFN